MMWMSPEKSVRQSETFASPETSARQSLPPRVPRSVYDNRGNSAPRSDRCASQTVDESRDTGARVVSVASPKVHARQSSIQRVPRDPCGSHGFCESREMSASVGTLVDPER